MKITKNLKQKAPVTVVWRDSMADSPWAAESVSLADPPTISSRGFVRHITPLYLTICMSLGGSQSGQHLSIPWGAVVSVEVTK